VNQLQVRAALAGALWLASAGTAAASSRHRAAALAYPALLAAGAALTAAVLTERLLVHRDEQEVAAVLAALQLDRRLHEAGAAAGLRLIDNVSRLPGGPVQQRLRHINDRPRRVA
jgi:hypothetical protein